MTDAGPVVPKAILVTGAAAGLGEAIALGLAERRARIGLCDIDEMGARRVARLCLAAGASDAAVIPGDLASHDGPGKALDQALAKFGQLDGLVNNAGFATVEPFQEITAEAWDRTFNVNVRAVALLCSVAGKAMAEAGGGRIVNITSPAARMALPNYAHYAASKAAVDSITRTAAIALAPHGVTVNSMAPGMMDTVMQETTERMMAEVEGRNDLRVYLDERTARVPVGRRTDPAEMAGLVIWLLLDAPDYLTAERLNGSGGLDRD
jgi:NAD(P)-dependent dehydrogenase (short-subunit alcohol dehydrogenase family)